MSQILLLLCSSSLSHFSAHWEKHVAVCAWGGERRYGDWKGSAAPAHLAKQQFMEDHQSPALMLYIPVWIDLYLEVRLYTRSPLAFASLMQNSPQNRRSAPPRPPASQQEKDQSESRAVNPSAIQAHYRAKTSPAFHALTVDGSQKPYSSKSKGSKRGDDTRLNLPLHSSWITAA